MREDSDNIKLEDFNDFTISRNSIPKNPYKRVKKNNSYNTRELNNNSIKNQHNNILNLIFFLIFLYVFFSMFFYVKIL